MFSQSLDHYQQAIELSRRFQKPQWEMLALGLIAQIHTIQKEYELALELKRSILDETKATAPGGILGFVYKDLANLFLTLDQVDSAAHYAEQAIQVAKEPQFAVIKIEGMIVLGKIQMKMGKVAQARRTLENAIDESKASKSQGLQVQASLELIQILTTLREFEQAQVKAFEALATAQQGNTIELEIEVYRELEQLYASRDDFQRAYEFLSLASGLQTKRSEELDQTQAGWFVIYQQQGQNRLSQVVEKRTKEIRSKSDFYGIFIFVCLGILVLLFFLVNRIPYLINKTISAQKMS